VVAYQFVQAFQVVGMDAWRRLGLDRNSQVIDDEVDLDAAGEAPVGEFESKRVSPSAAISSFR
jgi:hypothetical protein